MTFKTTRFMLLGATLTTSWIGCASTGTRPGDMSAANHEATAEAEQKNSGGHAAQYDPNAVQKTTQSHSCSGYEAATDCSSSWTSVSNPTEKHRADAVSHRDLASKHRAASAALRDAEARSCRDVPAADRDMSPFDHQDDIARVENISENTGPSVELGGATKGGVRVFFAARPGMTAEWLQRVVDCHMARNAVMHYQMSEMEHCPLNIRGATAQVTSTGNGFAVSVVSTDSAVARKIQSQARALTPAGQVVGVR